MSLDQMAGVLPPLDAPKTPCKPADNWIAARQIYMDRLHDVLTPLVYETIRSIYADAVRLTDNPNDPEQVMKTFMDFLAETKVWSINIINGETQELLKKCPWFASLLKGVFVSNVMVLSSAQLNRPNAPVGRVRLNIPTCPVFVQALYSNVATQFFNRPNLFQTQGLTSDQQIENKTRAYQIIDAAIDVTVRELIPLPDVIESSMNFQGNPIITAKPAAAPPRRSVRRSSPAVETLKSPPTQPTRPTPVAAAVQPTKAPTPVAPKASPAPPKKEEHNEFRQSMVRKSAIAFRRSSQPPRPSQFRQRTGSEAVNKVLGELNLSPAHSSSSSSSDSDEDGLSGSEYEFETIDSGDDDE